MRKKTAAVIVTYNNSSMLANLLQNLHVQTVPPDEIIVIDNCSMDDTQKVIPASFPQVHYVRLNENIGSAGGYHEGIKRAVTMGDLIWTLDDDVGLKIDSLEKLLSGLNNLHTHKKVGAVRSVGENHPHNVPTELEIAPWRATLFLKEAIKDVGFPRKDLFLYGGDIEYSLRLRKQGYVIFWIPESKYFDERQEKTKDRLLWKNVKIYPSTFRLYYAFRNEVFVLLAYRRLFRLARTLLYALKVSVYILIKEKWKGFKKLVAILKGILHGFTGRLGMNESYTPHR